MVRCFETDDYHPAYGMLLLADTNQAWDPTEDPPLPHHRDRGDMPTGSFAGTGAGWLSAQAPDLGDHTVRLELHDTPPPPDPVVFEDVVEAPFRSSSGELTLTDVTGGYGEADLELGDTEWFRVRVARRSAGDDFSWLIRFWPDPLGEPPTWLARGPETGEHAQEVAEDVEALLRWIPGLPLETSVDDLSHRLLVSTTTVRAALEAAETKGLLHIVTTDPLRLTVGRT